MNKLVKPGCDQSIASCWRFAFNVNWTLLSIRLIKGVCFLLWLPLSAQLPELEPMKVEFGFGVKTACGVSGLIGDMTHNNPSLGVLFETRMRLRGNKAAIRLRGALDDWGNNAFRGHSEYQTELRRFRGTIGMLSFLSKSRGPTTTYVSFEAGVTHWDINSSHPLFGREKYTRMAAGFAVGVETKYMFWEFAPFGLELEAMDTKGYEGGTWVGGGTLPGHYEKRKVRDLGGTFALLVVGYKFGLPRK